MAKLLFKTTEEMRDFCDVPASTEFSVLRPQIQAVQSRVIKQIIGFAELENLLSKYDTDEWTAEERKLVEYIRVPLAQMAMWKSLPTLNVNIQSGGITVTNNESSVAASQWRIDELREQLAEGAQSGIDDLLEYLEENAGDHPLYSASEERALLKSNIINTTKVFNQFSDIPVSRWALVRMKPIMTRVEDLIIKKAIGAELLAHIRTQISTGGSLGVYEPLLPLIQRPVALFTLASSLNSLALEITDQGVRMTFKNAINDNAKGYNRPEDSPYYRQMIGLSSSADLCMNELRVHLNNNAATYPLFEASDAYTGTVQDLKTIQQIDSSGTFAAL